MKLKLSPMIVLTMMAIAITGVKVMADPPEYCVSDHCISVNQIQSCPGGGHYDSRAGKSGTKYCCITLGDQGKKGVAVDWDEFYCYATTQTPAQYFSCGWNAHVTFPGTSCTTNTDCASN